MKNLKLTLVAINIFFSSLLMANEIPNIQVFDNPNRPVTTFETKRKRDKAILNLDIKKITSEPAVIYINEENKIMSFIIDKIEDTDSFYLADTKEVFSKNLDTSKLPVKYTFKETRIEDKVVSFKYNNEVPQTLYLIKYDTNTKKMKKLYKVEKENIHIIDNAVGTMIFKFTEKYKPYEILELSNDGILEKCLIDIKHGEYFKIDPTSVSEIQIKSTTGEILKSFTLKTGTGSAELNESKKGIALKEDGGVLNFGIGFKNGILQLQVKEVTDVTKLYSFVLEVKNIDNTTSRYNVSISPAQYSFKILNSSINLDFSKATEVISEIEKETKEISVKGEILIDTKGFDIKVTFANNGAIKLKNGDNVIDAKLETNVVKNSEVKDIKKVEVVAVTDKENIKNLPEGDYNGNAELVISIDS